MPERPRLFLETRSTSSTSYVTLLDVKISPDSEGICFFSLGIDPDPNALYKVVVSNILNVNDLELTAMFNAVFEHLSSGVYRGFKAGDAILIQHKTIDSVITVKTGVALAFNEVVKR